MISKAPFVSTTSALKRGPLNTPRCPALSAALCALTLCVVSPLPASAQLQPAPAAPSEPAQGASLSENFSPWELSTIGASTLSAIYLVTLGERTFGSPTPSLGAPDPQSLDARFTRWANPVPDPARQWLGGVPDTAGYVAPFAALGFYAVGSASRALNDDSFLGEKSHQMVAFTEAFAWTMVITNALKLSVGRARPFTIREGLDTEGFGEPEKEYFLSFPSGHSASAAATSTFLALDLSRHLVSETFAESHPALRYGVGYALPAVGAAAFSSVVMYSRIKDQRHWLSDTITGAMIGAGCSTLFYIMHFDERGDPRRRREVDAPDSVLDTDEPLEPMTSESYMMPSASPSGAMLTYGFAF